MIKIGCNGCFDGLHAGHLFFFGYAAAQGDYLSVGINTDDYIRQNKRPQPFYDEKQRVDMLLSIPVINEVHVFPEDDPAEFIKRLSPDIYCISESYGEDCIDAQVCRNLNFNYVMVPNIGKWSTSELNGSTVLEMANERNK